MSDDDFYDLEDRDDKMEKDYENAWDPEVNPPYFNDPMIPLPTNIADDDSKDFEQVRELNTQEKEGPIKQVRKFDHLNEAGQI